MNKYEEYLRNTTPIPYLGQRVCYKGHWYGVITKLTPLTISGGCGSGYLDLHYRPNVRFLGTIDMLANPDQLEYL